MKKIISSLLASLLMLSCNDSPAVSEGEEVIDVTVRVTKSAGVDLYLTNTKYKNYMTDEDFRSKSPQIWLSVLRDRDGKAVEEVFFRFKESQKDLVRTTVSNSKKYEESYDFASIIFRYSRKAEKVEIYKDEKLIASALVPHAQKE